ncbi:16S RNA G1207 methylase RsmC [Longispora fulva]|uniref:16S rRNA G1207 methylase RsmC n=1 Tax=Longispora fulva TaxID=619741 RepID=A0A8J7KSX9_9ACTN|nr:methyltransferase [Longispora fulva]MBG6140112.1 16S rRNA G1207 methylase RsmC [Longispora fulva]GIG57512.1 16S RNA G1207 methylase RsmC [Longispora fulva]
MIDISVDSTAYQFTVSSGVFSANRLDPGTAVLFRKAPRPGRGVFLDLGCGYGPISCVFAHQSPKVTMYAVDVNERALELVHENALALGVTDRVIAAKPDDVPADVVFDGIYSNPPIHVGKEALHEMLLRWLPRLGPDAEAWLVVARHLGGDSLRDWLVAQGWSAEKHASQKGYRILKVGRAETE